ncbi:MAG TPA: HAMP domain-containing sensor histidine kinase, partial [Chryseolinea sp.]|nr:HAMP domain-containing sensor histidine kinase [Chryseolinea sp.]
MKLLARTVRNYLIYSASLILFSTPVFYYSIHELFIHDTDKALLAHKKDFLESIDHIRSLQDLELFHLMNEEFVFRPSANLAHADSIYSADLYDSGAARWAPHRIYESNVTILGQNFSMQIRESMVSNSELISAIMIIQLIILTLLFIGLVFINRNLSQTIWKPFYIILDRLRKYRIDKDTGLALPGSTTAEFRELNAAITHLIERSRAAYQDQKEFTENASHELGTPLAICRTKLELLAQTKELTEEQAELVGSLLEATDRIARLNKNLLLLSKIENRQFFESEPIDLLTVVTKALDAYKDQASGKNIFLKCNIGNHAVVSANPALFELIAFNLISNAIRHTPE